jgi:hypothetical protein
MLTSKAKKDLEDYRRKFLSPSVDFDGQVQSAIHELNDQGVRLTDFPESIRQRAFELESAFTEAANQGDHKRFLELLAEWRKCFH